MKQYINSFIIGSSWPISIFMIMIVKKMMKKKYNLVFYAVFIPFYMGIINMISLFIANRFNLSYEHQYYLTGLISAISMISIAFYNNTYDWEKMPKINYVIYLFVFHNIIIQVIMKNVNKQFNNCLKIN